MILPVARVRSTSWTALWLYGAGNKTRVCLNDVPNKPSHEFRAGYWLEGSCLESNYIKGCCGNIWHTEIAADNKQIPYKAVIKEPCFDCEDFFVTLSQWNKFMNLPLCSGKLLKAKRSHHLISLTRGAFRRAGSARRCTHSPFQSNS